MKPPRNENTATNNDSDTVGAACAPARGRSACAAGRGPADALSLVHPAAPGA